MTEFIIVNNRGPEVTDTNYWATEQARKGYLYLSINAGTFRLLVPDSLLGEIEEWKTANEVIVSRGPWPAAKKPDALEILFEDNSDNPYTLHLGVEQVDRLPTDADQDQPGQSPRWKFTVWTRTGKVLEFPCRYRRVESLPCLDPWAK